MIETCFIGWILHLIHEVTKYPKKTPDHATAVENFEKFYDASQAVMFMILAFSLLFSNVFMILILNKSQLD
jgi:hypothetical protein